MGSATYVYVISGDHGRQKIGSSDDPARRIKELQTGSPYQLRFEFIGETEGRGGGAVEVQAHFMLHEHKAPGGDEWFTVPPDVAITAVMAAAHRLGYQCKPVNPDGITPINPKIARPWPIWVWVVMSPIYAWFMYWILVVADERMRSGEMPFLAFAIEFAIIWGAIWLVQIFVRAAGRQFIAAWLQFDRMMHPEGR